MSGQNHPVPGWYPDNVQPGILRWWDGSSWTQETMPIGDLTSTASLPIPSGKLESNQVLAKAKGIFGSKKDLEAEIASLKEQLANLGVFEAEQLRKEILSLQQTLPALRLEAAELLKVIEPLRYEVDSIRREKAEVEQFRQQVNKLRDEKTQLEKAISDMGRNASEAIKLQNQVNYLKSSVVETNETIILQEVGIYSYRHPLDGSPAYKARISGIQANIKDSAKAGTAVKGATNWTVNGSAREGAKMVKEFSKLMLRAYNNEADNAVRSMKPYTLESSIARLDKARETIVKLGGTMNIRITDSYHALRVQELELTADYLAKIAEEKEKQRLEREKIKENEMAQRELEREQERLKKEQSHYTLTLAKLKEEGNLEAATELEKKLEEIGDAIDGISKRAANIRAGHVYIISNIGAFGPNVVKVGMTRRLDPTERIRELSDASVPFHYDIHALIFSDDAVGLETHLHHKLDNCRLNRVNARKEFFRAHPNEVRELLDTLGANILEWQEEPEALEWRQSQSVRLEVGSN